MLNLCNFTCMYVFRLIIDGGMPLCMLEYVLLTMIIKEVVWAMAGQDIARQHKSKEIEEVRRWSLADTRELPKNQEVTNHKPSGKIVEMS